MTEVSDSIQRTVTFSAPIDRVWKAITQPSMIEQWFGDKAEFANLAVGERILFGWGEHKSRGQIAVVEPPHRFAYRWENATDAAIPYQDANTTLVTFTLSEVAGGTELTVLETGFASLPAHLREKALAQNTSGWDAELNDLKAYLDQ